MNRLAMAGEIVNSLSRSIWQGNQTIETIPRCITQIVDEELWQDRIDSMTGRHEHFDSFQEFAETVPTRGLGVSVSRLEDLCRSDPRALEAITRALTRRAGNPHPSGSNQHAKKEVIVDNIHDYHPASPDASTSSSSSSSTPAVRPAGTSRAAGLRALARKAPEQLELVVAGKKSTHRAMVDAGLRVVKTPLEKIRALYRRLSDDDRRAFLDEVLR